MAYLSNSYIPFSYPSVTFPDIMAIFLARRDWKGKGLWLGWSCTKGMAAGQGDTCTTVVKQREDTGDQIAVSFPLFYLVWELNKRCPSYIFSQSSRISSHYPNKCLLVQSNWSNPPSHRCLQSLCFSHFAFCFLHLSNFLRLYTLPYSSFKCMTFLGLWPF